MNEAQKKGMQYLQLTSSATVEDIEIHNGSISKLTKFILISNN